MNTMQQEFDAVVAHLYKQNRPAKTSGNECNYRLGSLSCAVGCRIPDSVYVPEMDKVSSSGEGTDVHELVNRFGEIIPKEILAYTSLFSGLQRAHDGCPVTYDGTFNRSSLNALLCSVAARYDLEFTPQ